MSTERYRRRLVVSFAALLVISFVTTGGTLVLYARSMAGVRTDFCTYAATVYKVTLEFPQVHARVEAERNDLNLMSQLGCPQGGNL